MLRERKLSGVLGLLVLVAGCTPEGELGESDEGLSLPPPVIQVDGHQATPTPRFVRLTHLQWERSIQDVFGLVEPTGLSETFIQEGATGGFSTDSQHLQVDSELWLDYQRAAEEVAQFVARSPERLARIVDLDWSVEQASVNGCVSPGTLELMPSCCNGDATCMPAAMIDSSLHERMEACEGGGFCAPHVVLEQLNMMGFANAAECVEKAGGAGACMDPCFPEIGYFADFMHQGTCDDGLLCTPCINPLDGKDSGACDWEIRCPSHGMDLATYIARRDGFIASLGRRLFRRPLSVGEVERYASMFELGVNLLGADDFLPSGVEYTLRAMLQSPHFLYRIERSREVNAEGQIILDGWEVAARLSLVLWNTTPSEAMLDAASEGEFDEVNSVYAWVRTMLGDARAEETLVDFHRQLFKTSSYDNIQKDPTRFPDFNAETGAHMATEFDLFVKDVLVSEAGGLNELLTSTHSFVNEELAEIYGLSDSAMGQSFERVELDPRERSGILTRLGFLADRASLNQPDPIRRGVLVAEHIICAHLPPPPPNIQALPVDTAPTNRERVELHTGDGTCGQGCHSTIINPAGFPFEHYDAVGGYRLEDNGYPVNAADVYMLDGVATAYEDAIAFSDALAASLQVHRCYTEHWLEYLYGRRAEALDDALIEAVAEVSHRGELSVNDAIAVMLSSSAFLSRSASEVEVEEAP